MSELTGKFMPSIGHLQIKQHRTRRPRPERPRRTPAPKSDLPESWIPSESEANRDAERDARQRGVSIELELAKMRDWSKSGGSPCRDWDARWRNWLRAAVARLQALEANRDRGRNTRAQRAVDRMIGRVFYRLTVVGMVGVEKNGAFRYLCTCTCGRTCRVRGSNLRCGITRSCGCYSSELSRERALAKAAAERNAKAEVVR